VISCPLTSSKIVICTITVTPPPGTHAVDATITRAGKLYAHSRQTTVGRHVRLRLHLRHALAKGRYGLTIQLLGIHGARHTIRTQITVT
jgi:hypothetical protein